METVEEEIKENIKKLTYDIDTHEVDINNLQAKLNMLTERHRNAAAQIKAWKSKLNKKE